MNVYSQKSPACIMILVMITICIGKWGMQQSGNIQTLILPEKSHKRLRHPALRVTKTVYPWSSKKLRL